MAAIKPEIDLTLEVLCIITPPQVTLSTIEIAELCGCHKSNIDQTIKSGLKKLERQLDKNDYL